VSDKSSSRGPSLSLGGNQGGGATGDRCGGRECARAAKRARVNEREGRLHMRAARALAICSNAAVGTCCGSARECWPAGQGCAVLLCWTHRHPQHRSVCSLYRRGGVESSDELPPGGRVSITSLNHQMAQDSFARKQKGRVRSTDLEKFFSHSARSGRPHANVYITDLRQLCTAVSNRE
jgi:hypothetical protein